MSEATKTRELLIRSTEILQRWLAGDLVAAEFTSTGESAEEAAFVQAFSEFARNYHEGLTWAGQLANGEMDTVLPRSNKSFAALKKLHSSLQHLSWQLERLACGDLSQEVLFMGDFSQNFNGLIRILREKQELEEKLKQREALFRAIFELAPDIIAIYNPNGEIMDVSTRALQLLGYTDKQELLGTNMLDHLVPAYHEKATLLIGEMLAGNYTGATEYKLKHRDGSEIWVESNAEVLRNAAGEMEAVFSISRDIGEKMELEEKISSYVQQLEIQARTDGLTQVFNRSHGIAILQQEMDKAEQLSRSLAICFIDIDSLKWVNDMHGHLAGDQLILVMTRCMQQCCRASDTLCRLGGDEFLMVLVNCNEAVAAKRMQELEQRAGELSAAEHLPVSLSFSYGISTVDPGGQLTLDEVVRLADQRMYVQKKAKKSSNL